MVRKIKAVGLFSGGLDSILSHIIMLEQNIDVIAYHIKTPFTTSIKKHSESKASVERLTQQMGIKLEVEHLVSEYIEMVRKPHYGYGSDMNPCIDCKIMFLSKSHELMKRIGAHFVFTGEVLGQRPMSQNLNSLTLIEKRSGLKGFLLRPLSAKLLPPTVPEERGWVDRNKLLALQGRTRKPQISLAKKYGIDNYLTPAGGCLLTDPGFSERLSELFEHAVYDVNSILLLQIGRHFRIGTNTKLIVGRNQHENNLLAEMTLEGDVLLETEGVGSPLCMIRGDAKKEHIILSAKVCKRYSDARELKKAQVRFWKVPGQKIDFLEVENLAPEKIKEMQI